MTTPLAVPPAPIKLTDDDLTRLYEEVAAQLVTTIQNDRNGDDGGDYTFAALEVYRVLQEATQDQSHTTMVEDYLNFRDLDASWMPEDFPIQVTPLCNLAYEGGFLEFDPPALFDPTF